MKVFRCSKELLATLLDCADGRPTTMVTAATDNGARRRNKRDGDYARGPRGGDGRRRTTERRRRRLVLFVWGRSLVTLSY